MIELLEFIFQSGWTYFGTLLILIIVSQAVTGVTIDILAYVSKLLRRK